jgi:hypothetical protein
VEELLVKVPIVKEPLVRELLAEEPLVQYQLASCSPVFLLALSISRRRRWTIDWWQLNEEYRGID